ncbi:hypothetical protein ABK040_005784 [Willaertia magna]
MRKGHLFGLIFNPRATLINFTKQNVINKIFMKNQQFRCYTLDIKKKENEQQKEMNIYTFTNQLKNLCKKSGSNEEVLQNLLSKFPVELYDNVIYNHILGFYIKRKQYKKAEEIFYKIKSPDTQNYTQILKCYAYEGNIKKVEEIFNKIKNPDIYVYNSLLVAYSNQRMTKEIEKIYNSIKDKKIANNFTFSILIEAYCKAEEFTKVENFFKEIMEIYKDNVDIQVFNTLLSGLQTYGQYERALKYFETYITPLKLKYQNVKPTFIPNERTILIMLLIVESLKDETKFSQTIHLMRYLKIKPNNFINTKVIQNYFNRKKFNLVVDWFDNIRKLERIHPLAHRFVLQSYAILDKVEEVKSLVRTAEKSGFITNQNCHNYIYSLTLIKEYNEAEKLFLKFKNQELSEEELLTLYNSMLLCYVRSGDQKKALHLFKHYPIPPNQRTMRIISDEQFGGKQQPKQNDANNN